MPVGRPNRHNRIFVPMVFSYWGLWSRTAQAYINGRIAGLA